MLLRRIIPVALAAALTLSVSADDRNVYRWTDADGNVQFSDRPLTDKAETTGLTSKTTDSSRITQNKQARIEQNQAIAAKEGESALSAEKQAKEDERYAENCRRAKAAFASIQNARRLYEPAEDGSRRYLDEQQIADRIASAQADVDEWCR